MNTNRNQKNINRRYWMVWMQHSVPVFLFFSLIVGIYRIAFGGGGREKNPKHLTTSNVDYIATEIDHRLHSHDELSVKDAVASLAEELSSLLRHAINKKLTTIRRIYVIPGGGSGSESNSAKGQLGYPEWTSRRVEAAYQHYLLTQTGTEATGSRSNNSVFLALSAGSLNNANRLQADGRIVFECQHTIRHLKSLGIDEDLIFGDFSSWDTVTNAVSLRTFTEAILTVQTPFNEEPQTVTTNHRQSLKGSSSTAAAATANAASRRPSLAIEVFISDFHLDRVREAFSWILNVLPRLPADITLNMHSVSSQGIAWSSPEAFQSRIKHERVGYERMRMYAAEMRTMDEVKAFLWLGPHQGLRSYLNGDYVTSHGAGW